MLSLLVNLTIRKEIPIMENQVLSLSSLFSTLASAVSKKNNALQKTKTAAAKTNCLTNTGVDDFSKLGFLESSRSYQRDKEFLAAISEDILKRYAQTSVPQITFDNMDLGRVSIKHCMEYWSDQIEKIVATINSIFSLSQGAPKLHMRGQAVQVFKNVCLKLH